MPRIHFVVNETAKIAYQTQASREGKSLGQWMREAAAGKLAATRPRKFTLEEMRKFTLELERFNAECDARRSHQPEPDWADLRPGPGGGVGGARVTVHH